MNTRAHSPWNHTARFIRHPLAFILLLTLLTGCPHDSTEGDRKSEGNSPRFYAGLPKQSVGIMVWADRGILIDKPSLQLDLANQLQDTLIKSKAQTGGLAEASAPLKLGGDWSGEMFTGVLDEVRVYNVALTQAQLQTDMSTPIDGVPPTGETRAQDGVKLKTNREK